MNGQIQTTEELIKFRDKLRHTEELATRIIFADIENDILKRNLLTDEFNSNLYDIVVQFKDMVE